MMRSFQLSQYKRANVWLDEPPPAQTPVASLVSRTVKPIVAIDAARQVVGVELVIPHGPRASYGLLGAELFQSDAEGLEIRVSVSKVGLGFKPSIALQPDEANVGLPDEYVDAVLTGVSNVARLSGSPVNAALWFRWAAHGRVGSSPWIFEKLGGVTLRLLMLPREPSDEDIESMLR